MKCDTKKLFHICQRRRDVTAIAEEQEEKCVEYKKALRKTVYHFLVHPNHTVLQYISWFTYDMPDSRFHSSVR